jgi:hypothetical protein
VRWREEADGTGDHAGEADANPGDSAGALDLFSADDGLRPAGRPPGQLYRRMGWFPVIPDLPGL